MTRVYEYDVFISYKRGGRNVPAWIRNHFYPRLSEWLDDHLDRDVKVFFDERITVGTVWPQELRRALQRSRILLPVCSPKYFEDEWCLAEWYSMADREELISAAATPRPLIYPVIFCDSANFPDFARNRLMRSFKDWNLPQPQFEECVGYIAFQQEITKLAEELAELVERAPLWRPDWPVHTPTAPPSTSPIIPRF